MKFKAAIFDLDGTLINSLEDIADSLNGVLRKNNFPTHLLDRYRYLVGYGVWQLVEYGLPEAHRQDETVEKCLGEYREAYRQNWKVKTQPYEGIPEMLQALAGTSVKMAVLSNKVDDMTKLCVEEFLPNGGFEVVMGQQGGIPKKPDPKSALMIADQLKCRPEEVAYFGDTSVDMQTASAAGMYAVGVLWGFRSREELLEYGAKRLCEKPLEILSVFD
ncbi:MAG: HAD family hydrolase [Chlorobiales bacterium]|nr:HAD family hydrolase [Chlorobiales bacterium]